jgi:hypothetical protein
MPLRQTTTAIKFSQPVQYHDYAAAQMRKERQSRLEFYRQHHAEWQLGALLNEIGVLNATRHRAFADTE